jgi:hypothetical protein
VAPGGGAADQLTAHQDEGPGRNVTACLPGSGAAVEEQQRGRGEHAEGQRGQAGGHREQGHGHAYQHALVIRPGRGFPQPGWP